MKEIIKSILFQVIYVLILLALLIIYILYKEPNAIIELKDELVSEVTADIKIDSEDKAIMDKTVEIAYIFLGVTIILFVISYEMINKEKIPKESSKELEDLISPSLAEAVIDGKIEFKNLIMTTIIDLSIRGNIEIINNEIVRLISKENLEPHELEIIDLIFQENVEIAFKDINTVFKDSRDGTIEFGKRIEKIKIAIMDKLYKKKIFSNFKTFDNKAVTLVAILNIMNTIFLLAEHIGFNTELVIEMNILVPIFYITLSLKGVAMLNEKSRKNGGLITLVIILLLFSPFILIDNIKRFIIYKPQILVIALVIIFINILVIKNKKEVVLTEQGKIEKIKLLRLKNYINEYSLIKDRDLTSTIVWDKYLAYATAFGIPNKVTSSIYESWYNLNITLQMINKFM